MKHIDYGRLIALAAFGGASAFGVAFAAYLNGHMPPDTANAGQLYASMSHAAIDAAQKAAGAIVLAIIGGLTRTDSDLPVNGLFALDEPPVDDAPTAPAKITRQPIPTPTFTPEQIAAAKALLRAAGEL